MNVSPDLHDSICIGSLALGLQYRLHAKLLAFDLLFFHPEIKLVLLTDSPDFFRDLPNVIAMKHKSTGIRFCYHDKRFVFEKAFQLYSLCLFVDADSRLVDPIDFDELLDCDAFIVAPIAELLQKKIEREALHEKSGIRFNGAFKKARIFNALSEKMGVKFDELTFVQESIFLINKTKGDYQKFLNTWDCCAIYTTGRLLEFSEGSSIGLSAKVAGGKISSINKCPAWYFKDQYTDHRWKDERQALLSKNLMLLRAAISNDDWCPSRGYVRLAALGWAAFTFYLKNARRLLFSF